MNVKPLDYRQLRIMAGPFPETIKIVYRDGREHSPCTMAKHAAEYIARGAVDMRPGAKARATTTHARKPATKPRKALSTMSTKNPWASHDAAIEAVLASAAGVLSKAEIAGYRRHGREIKVAALQQIVADRRASQSTMDVAMGIQRPGADRAYRRGAEMVFPVAAKVS